MKLIERTENLKTELNIELGRTVSWKISTRSGWGAGGLGGMEPLNPFHAEKRETEIISSYLVISPRLIFQFCDRIFKLNILNI